MQLKHGIKNSGRHIESYREEIAGATGAADTAKTLKTLTVLIFTLPLNRTKLQPITL